VSSKALASSAIVIQRYRPSAQKVEMTGVPFEKKTCAKMADLQYSALCLFLSMVPVG
jgi:hypothetical protein